MHILKHVIHRLFQEAAGADGAAGGEMGGDQSQPTAEQLAAVEQRAREMGWAPKEEWRGNPQGWLDASAFVRRGEEIMPLLQANLRKRDTEVATLRQQVERQNQQLQVANESLQVLTNLSTEQSRNAAKEKRRELLKQQAEARTAGNTDLEIDIGEQIADVTAEINAAPAAAPQTKNPKGKTAAARPIEAPIDNPVNDPAYQSFLRENSWFGTDNRKTALATAIGQELRANPANKDIVGKPFFDMVVAEVNKVFAPARPAPNKVESASNGAGRSNGVGTNDNDPTSGKSFADLPQDAKEACERQAKLLVGEGRAFKDVASWRKHYVSMYFNS